MRKSKHVEYSFLIICEGNNTEPSFFQLIRDEIIDGYYKISPYRKDEISITIRPEPKKMDDEDADQMKDSPHKPKRQSKTLKKQEGNFSSEKTPYPLNFIIEGQLELKDGTYDEVWAVFDHDNHPARKQAFEQSEELVNGKRVQVAFSSISFEYYLLIHFDRIYKDFKRSECRENEKRNKTLFYCGTGKDERDCYGQICVGGYARSNGYWVESKSTASTFPLVKDKLEVGFINSAWVRNESQKRASDLMIYDRNPYLTTDFLVKRLTGNDKFTYEWLSLKEYKKVGNVLLKVENFEIFCRNIDYNIVIIPANSVQIQYEDGSVMNLGERLEILPGDEKFIYVSQDCLANYSCIIFEYDSFRSVFNF